MASVVHLLAITLPAYLPLILLSVALVVGLIMARRIWEETHEECEPASEFELLSDLENAHAAGELNEAELLKVRELIRQPRLANAPANEQKPPRSSPETEDEAAGNSAHDVDDVPPSA